MSTGTPRNCAKFFDELRISISELAKKADLDEASIRRIRNGLPVAQTTFNKFVDAMAAQKISIKKEDHFQSLPPKGNSKKRK